MVTGPSAAPVQVIWYVDPTVTPVVGYEVTAILAKAEVARAARLRIDLKSILLMLSKLIKSVSMVTKECCYKGR